MEDFLETIKLVCRELGVLVYEFTKDSVVMAAVVAEDVSASCLGFSANFADHIGHDVHRDSRHGCGNND